MGEKLYRPILKDGDHLVKSKKNEGRVRGISQDKNNKNPDIIEWEEVDDSIYNYSDEQYESERMKSGGFSPLFCCGKTKVKIYSRKRHDIPIENRRGFR